MVKEMMIKDVNLFDQRCYTFITELKTDNSTVKSTHCKSLICYTYIFLQPFIDLYNKAEVIISNIYLPFFLLYIHEFWIYLHIDMTMEK